MRPPGNHLLPLARRRPCPQEGTSSLLKQAMKPANLVAENYRKTSPNTQKLMSCMRSRPFTHMFALTPALNSDSASPGVPHGAALPEFVLKTVVLPVCQRHKKCRLHFPGVTLTAAFFASWDSLDVASLLPSVNTSASGSNRFLRPCQGERGRGTYSRQKEREISTTCSRAVNMAPLISS